MLFVSNCSSSPKGGFRTRTEEKGISSKKNEGWIVLAAIMAIEARELPCRNLSGGPAPEGVISVYIVYFRLGSSSQGGH